MSLVLTERHGDVLKIILNKPERLNAATPVMFEDISAALAKLDGARSVLFMGAANAFCSGADLSMLGTAEDAGEVAYDALTRSYNPALFAIASLDVPVVSAVRGPAAGIGCSLALAADFCMASETGYFLQAFVKIGLVPDGGASWILPRLIGKARAAKMMMLGDRISAEEALEWGLVSRVVGDDMLDGEALAFAAELAERPALAARTLRGRLRSSHLKEYEIALAREANDQRLAAKTSDAAEGVRAFFDKRTPIFEGR